MNSPFAVKNDFFDSKGKTTPVIRSIKVVLPMPLGPIMPVQLLFKISKLKSLSIFVLLRLTFIRIFELISFGLIFFIFLILPIRSNIFSLLLRFFSS